MSKKKIKLWLEFEEYVRCEEQECLNTEYGIHKCNEFFDDSAKKYNDFCNVQVKVGKKMYALSLWTYNFFARAVVDNSEMNISIGWNVDYIEPPDLFVIKLERSYLEEVFNDLVERKAMKKEWRIK